MDLGDTPLEYQYNPLVFLWGDIVAASNPTRQEFSSGRIT